MLSVCLSFRCYVCYYTLCCVFHTIVSKRLNVNRTDLGCNDLCHQSKLGGQTSTLSLKSRKWMLFSLKPRPDDGRSGCRWYLVVEPSSLVKWHEFNFNTIVPTHTALLRIDPPTCWMLDRADVMIWISPKQLIVLRLVRFFLVFARSSGLLLDVVDHEEILIPLLLLDVGRSERRFWAERLETDE